MPSHRYIYDATYSNHVGLNTVGDWHFWYIHLNWFQLSSTLKLAMDRTLSLRHSTSVAAAPESCPCEKVHVVLKLLLSAGYIVRNDGWFRDLQLPVDQTSKQAALLKWLRDKQNEVATLSEMCRQRIRKRLVYCKGGGPIATNNSTVVFAFNTQGLFDICGWVQGLWQTSYQCHCCCKSSSIK